MATLLSGISQTEPI